MTYEEFKEKFLPEFLKIRSFAGKIKYAEQYLPRIGSGSGRVVYDIDGQKILKLAKNTKGVAQNEVEASAGFYPDTHNIVAIIFDSADDDSWLISEKAKKVTEKRIKEITGIPSLWDLRKYLSILYDKNHRKPQTYSLEPEITELLNENEFAQELFEFVANYNQIVGDYGRPSTYGEVIRDGQPAIVLTDYGLNDEVYNTYYSPDRKQRYSIYEMYNFADGNDDILGDLPQEDGIDTRKGMWALVPYGVGDGNGVINEEIVDLISNTVDYSSKNPLPAMPILVEGFNECIGNIKEVLNRVKNKKKFYNNLLKLQEFLISENLYNRDRLIKEEYDVSNIPPVKGYTLDDKAYATEIAKNACEKIGLTFQKYLGGGSNGFAFLTEDGNVFKVSADVSEGDAAAKLMRVQPITIAKVYNIYKIFDTDTNLSFIGIVEEYIEDKPENLFLQYGREIDEINPNEMSYVDFLIKMKKNFNYDEMVGLAKGVLNQNPNANISSVERKKIFNYLVGLFNIKNELVRYDIKSNDYGNRKNLGYKNNILMFFDFGGYRSPEPAIGEKNIIYLPEGDEKINENIENKYGDIASKIARKLGVGNASYIDAGTNGVAYDIGNDRVLKITTDKSEANENIKLIGKKLKYIAEPYAVYVITSRTQNAPEVYAIVLEKLNTDLDEFKRMFHRLEIAFEQLLGVNFSDVVEAYLYGHRFETNVDINKTDRYFVKNPQDANFFFNIVNIAKEAEKYGIESIDYYNPKNLGYKKDGVIAFFDIGGGNVNSEPEAQEISVDEDGSSKFSSVDSIGRDDFPAYDQNDTSPLTDNNVPTTIDELVERVLSSMKGSSSVSVKKKCRLGGLGNTSTACNQGDIKNLDIKPLNEIGEGNTTPYTISILVSDEYNKQYRFTTEDGDKYFVVFNMFEEENNWIMSFGTITERGTLNLITTVNKGRVYRIMATLVKLVRGFILNTKPNSIMFEPVKAKGSEDRRRFELYLQFIIKNLPSGYSYVENDNEITIKRNNSLNESIDANWFNGSKVVDDEGNPLIVYHGTNNDFSRFSLKNAAQPIIWFSSDKDKIERGDAGAAGRSRIISAYLSIKKMAGWNEYEKYGLGQLHDMGYDGAKLDDDYFVFSPKQIKIIKDSNSKKNDNTINEEYIPNETFWGWISPDNQFYRVQVLNHKDFIMRRYRDKDYGWDYDRVFDAAIKDGWIRVVYEKDKNYRAELSLNGYDENRVKLVFSKMFYDLVKYGNNTIYLSYENPKDYKVFSTNTAENKAKLVNFVLDENNQKKYGIFAENEKLKIRKKTMNEAQVILNNINEAKKMIS